MSKTRKNSALVFQRTRSGAITESGNPQAAKGSADLPGKKTPPSLRKLVQQAQAKLDGGPVARGMAFYEIGRMLLKPYSTTTGDVLCKIRDSRHSQGLCFLASWDRAALEKELAVPRADGTLPNINYFAVLGCFLGPTSAESRGLLEQMRAENLSLAEFWQRFKEVVKQKYQMIVANRLSQFQLDSEP